MATYPLMPIVTDAYLADTTHLTTEQHGAYLLLLMAMWRSPGCRLSDDDDFLARIVRCTKSRWQNRIRPALESFLTVVDGFISQGRLLHEFERVKRLCEKKVAAANARWRGKPLKNNDTTHAPAYADAMHLDSDKDSDSESDSTVRVSESESESCTEHSPRAALADPPPTQTKLLDNAFEIWKTELGDVLPKPKRLDPRRRTRLRAVLSSQFKNDLDDWQAYCRQVRTIPFLLGQNDRGWRADFDFTLTDKALRKITEGAYRSTTKTTKGTHNGPAKVSSAREQALAEYLNESGQVRLDPDCSRGNGVFAQPALGFGYSGVEQEIESSGGRVVRLRT